MKVVQVNCVFDKGLTDPDDLLGRYTTLTGWSEALLAAGATNATVVQRFHRPARFTRNGVEYVFVSDELPPHLRPWQSSLPFAAAVGGLSPDVVHMNGLEFPAQARRIRSLLPDAAIVVQNHSGGGLVGRAPVLRLLTRATRSAVDAFLFAVDEHAESWRRAGAIAPRQRTYTVMPASTTFRLVPRDGARHASGIAGDPAVLWVGRLTANKDPLTVLDGFERCLARLPDASLTMIYGTDELLPDVRRRVEESNTLRARVRLVGQVAHDRMPAFFSAADVFVVGSHQEGSGYSVIEACACGAIPVVTRIPSFQQLTADGSIGALWTPGSAVDCARALVDVAAGDLVTSRAQVVDHFARALSWPAVGRRAVDVYAEVLKQAR